MVKKSEDNLPHERFCNENAAQESPVSEYYVSKTTVSARTKDVAQHEDCSRTKD